MTALDRGLLLPSTLLQWSTQHTFAPCSKKNMDFRTGGSTKRPFPCWSEIPTWFRTVWTGCKPLLNPRPRFFELDSNYVFELVSNYSHWFRTIRQQQHLEIKNVIAKSFTLVILFFRTTVLVVWNSSFRTTLIVFVLFVLVGAKVCFLPAALQLSCNLSSSEAFRSLRETSSAFCHLIHLFIKFPL